MMLSRPASIVFTLAIALFLGNAVARAQTPANAKPQTLFTPVATIGTLQGGWV